MNESELYKKLGVLTKSRNEWEESIPYVSSLLSHDSVKIQAKALWLLGEMGFKYPLEIQDSVPAIASLCDSPVPLFRRADHMNDHGMCARQETSVLNAEY